MARKPRVEFSGAFYHVIARGNRREVIFHDAPDYQAYLERLERYRVRDGGTIYAYVVMANHVHLLLETGSVPLSRTMQTLQFTYSQYYNRRYGKTGHVFQGRYAAILCDRESYLLELVRYLHLNPARVRRPLNPWQYPWSSHRAYLGQATPVQVHTGVVLEQFHRQVGSARQAYRQFLREGLASGHQERFYETVDQRFLGDERFVRELERRMGGKSAPAKRLLQVGFEPLLKAVAEIRQVPPAVLLQPGRQRAWVSARAMLVYLAREWSGLTTKAVAARLQRDPSMVSRLYAMYAGHREETVEARVRTALAREVNTHA